MHPVQVYVEDMSRLAIQKIGGEATSVGEVKRVVGLLCLDASPKIHDRVIKRVVESSIKSKDTPSSSGEFIDSGVAVGVLTRGIVPFVVGMICRS